MKSVRIQGFFGPDFPAFGLNTDRYSVNISLYSARMRGNSDPKNSQYRHFSRSLFLLKRSDFPSFLELTNVTPAFEKGDSNSKDNYRPVNISKIFNDVRFDKFTVLGKRFYQNINLDFYKGSAHNALDFFYKQLAYKQLYSIL